MPEYVKWTTIKVDGETVARIRQEAARRGVTVAAHLPAGANGDGGTRMFRIAAAGASGQFDITGRFDGVLAGLGFAQTRTDGPSA